MEGRPQKLRAVVVRPASLAEAPLLGPIELRAGERFREIGMGEIADDEPFELSFYEAAIAEGRVWVAELDGLVVGYVLALDLDGQAHLEQASVAPEAGGHGVGQALVDAVASWARGRGGASVTLSTFREVPWNAPWYERIGFTEIAEADLDARLLAVRDHEAADGLDVSARVFMRMAVGPASTL